MLNYRPRLLLRLFIFVVIGIVCGILLNFLVKPSHISAVLPPKRDINVFAKRTELISTGHGESKRCSSISTRLLFVIMSTPNPKGMQMRMLSRKLWASYKLPSSFQASMKFIVGTKRLLNHQISDLKNEQTNYRDLVLLDDHEDTYFKLTRKVKLALQWSMKNEQFHYLIKTDDDVIILLNKIVDALQKIGCPDNLYWGKYIRRLPRREGKYRDAEWGKICEFYLPYCTGVAYVLGRRVVQAITLYSDSLKYFILEDVSMGLWISPFSVTRVQDYNFLPWMSCSEDALVIHGKDSKTFENVTHNLLHFNRLCI